MNIIKLLLLVLFFLTSTNTFSQERSIYLNNIDYLTNGQFVDCGSPDYGTTDKITITVWVKESDIKTSYQAHEGELKWASIVTLDNHRQKDYGQFWLQHSTANQNFEWAVHSNSRQYITSTTIPELNKWYFISAVYNGADATATMKLYVNGTLESSLNSNSGNVRAFINDFKMNIGRMPSAYRLFSGNIDDLRIYWGTALTQDEIRQQMFSYNTINATNLKSFYRFNSTSGTTVTDEGSKLAHGTYYSALIDVHGNVESGKGYSRTLLKIEDNDKNWSSSNGGIWTNDTLITIAGNGLGFNVPVKIASNDSKVLTLNNWMNNNATYDPYEDNPPASNTLSMTWFGIRDGSSTSQWSTVVPPVGNNSTVITNNTTTYVGVTGGKISVTLSNGNNTNSVAIYQLGNISGGAVTSESFPSGVTSRSNINWGYNSWGSPTGNFEIDFTDVGGTTSTVKLLRRQRDGSWVDFTSSATLTYGVTKKFTISSLLSGGYEFALGGDVNNPLPVELTAFNASVTGNFVNLKWASIYENNNQGFEIYRKNINNNSFIKTGFVEGSGNSQTLKNYSFTDRVELSGTYQYKLVQNDFNGNTTSYYFPGNVSVSNPEKIKVSDNYPNPFNPTTKLDVSLPNNSYVSIKIYNIAGQEVLNAINRNMVAGYHSFELNLSNFSSGIYFCKISVNNGTNVYTNFKKLTLIK